MEKIEGVVEVRIIGWKGHKLPGNDHFIKKQKQNQEQCIFLR